MSNNNNEKIDDLDKELFEFFQNMPTNEVPDSTKKAVKKAFKRIKSQTTTLNKLSKVAVIVITFGILSTSIVFAKDIIDFITSLFNNSTKAIDTAVQNNYVQNIDMEFIYYDNIGIKSNSLIIDDTNMDISFIYDCTNLENIQSIELNDYIITDENSNLIYNTNYSEAELLVNSYIKYNKPKLITDGIFQDSIIYKSTNFPKFEKICFQISSLKIYNGDNYKIKTGIWNFEISIDKQLNQRKNKNLTISSNTFITDSSAELTETSLKINLNFNILLNRDIIEDNKKIILTDYNNTTYNYSIANLKDNSDGSTLYIEYDISKYSNISHNFELIINFNSHNTIKLLLSD